MSFQAFETYKPGIDREGAWLAGLGGAMVGKGKPRKLVEKGCFPSSFIIIIVLIIALLLF